MILKPFTVHSPDGKHFYEGEAPVKTDDPVQRWTGACMEAADKGGFVAYGDYLELKRAHDKQAEALRGAAVIAEAAGAEIRALKARIAELEAENVRIRLEFRADCEKHADELFELNRRINGAEPAGYFLHIASSWAQVSNEFKNDADVVPLYATPVTTGPRYDWTTTGMKQSETGSWVMAGAKP